MFCPRRKAANRRAAADPSRQPQAVQMVFDERHSEPKAGRSAQPISTLAPWGDIELSQLTCRVLPDDAFIRVSDSRVYVVTEVQPDGQGRARLRFNLSAHAASCDDLNGGAS